MDSISPVSSSEISWPNTYNDGEHTRDDAASQAEQALHGIYPQPTNLAQAVVNGDATDISNVCRRASPGSVDGYLCNDRNLHSAQDTLVDIAKKAAEKALELIFGAAK